MRTISTPLDYELTGQRTICSPRPNLSEALRPDVARRRTLLGVLLGLLLVILGTAGTALYKLTDGTGWYRYYPSVDLLRILEGSHEPAIRTAAWAELSRRDQEHELAVNARTRLIDACLAARAAGAAGQIGGQMEFLAECYLKDHMAPEQQDAYLRGLTQVALRVRPQVSAGSEVPFELAYQGKLPDSLQFRLADARIVNQPNGQVLAHWPELLCTANGDETLQRSFTAPPPGRCRASLEATAQVRRWGLGRDGRFDWQVRHQWGVSLATDLLISPADPPGAPATRAQ